MNRFLQVGLTALALTFAFPAWAICTPADLASRPWSMFIMEDLDGLAFTQRCLVRFNQAGGFILNSVCTVDTGETVFPRGGPINVSPSCGVSGTFLEVFPPPDPLEVVCRILGAMAPDKNTISGVGNCGPLVIFTFDMVKR